MWWKLELWALGEKKIPPGRHTLFHFRVLWEFSELVGPVRAEPKSVEETVKEGKENAEKCAGFVQSSTGFWFFQSGPPSKRNKVKLKSLGLNINIDNALASFSTGLECWGVCKIFQPVPQVGLLSSVQQVWAAQGKMVQDPINENSFLLCHVTSAVNSNNHRELIPSLDRHHSWVTHIQNIISRGQKM